MGQHNIVPTLILGRPVLSSPPSHAAPLDQISRPDTQEPGLSSTLSRLPPRKAFVERGQMAPSRSCNGGCQVLTGEKSQEHLGQAARGREEEIQGRIHGRTKEGCSRKDGGRDTGMQERI